MLEPVKPTLPKCENGTDEGVSLKSAISSENNDLFKMAYSIGAFLGDGSCFFNFGYGNGSWHTTDISTMDREVVERVQKEVKELCGHEYKIQHKVLKSGTDFFMLRMTRRALYDFFSVNTDNRRRIPEAIFTAPQEIKLALIAGMFDTDGAICESLNENGSRTGSNLRWQLHFVNTEEAMVKDLARLLQGIGVKVGSVTKQDKGYRLTSYRISPNLRSFITAGCYFEIKRKQALLAKYLEQVIGSETLYTDAATSA